MRRTITSLSLAEQLGTIRASPVLCSINYAILLVRQGRGNLLPRCRMRQVDDRVVQPPTSIAAQEALLLPVDRRALQLVPLARKFHLVNGGYACRGKCCRDLILRRNEFQVMRHPNLSIALSAT